MKFSNNRTKEIGEIIILKITEHKRLRIYDNEIEFLDRCETLQLANIVNIPL